MNKKIFFLLIIFLTILGGFLRFYNNTKNPPSLNIDEVSYGYSAYSVLKTLKDENGTFLPLSFKSTGDYKSPLLIYTLIPSIAVFGLNEFGIRFTTALAGTLSIPIFFILLVNLFKNTKIALTGATLLTISSWHIYYSRYASESLISTLFLMSGIWFLLKMLEGGRIWSLGAAVMLVASMYTYHSQKLFIPLFIFSIMLTHFKKFKSKKNNTLIFILVSILLVLPLLYSAIFEGSNTRVGMVFLSQDIEYTRNVILNHINRPGESFLLFFFWIKRYLNYFQPDYLFFTGLNMTLSGSLNLGVLYLFELPFLLLGIIKLIKAKLPGRKIITFWILLGLIPSSLANNEQSSLRSLLILPALLAVVSIGCFYLVESIISIKKRIFRFSLIISYLGISIIFLIQAFLIFSVHFPRQRGEDFMEGTKETVLYAIDNKDKFKEIVFDPYRGVEAPYIVNIPYMYILFYSKYDPRLFQSEAKKYGNDLFSFDKFTIRRIDWRLDRSKKDTLFIGSPWSLPLKDLKENEILRKIYLTNANLALLIVSPK